MICLGISGSLLYPNNHDASAALVIDGKLVGCYEEERFNGLKHSVGQPFPKQSILKLFDKANITLNDVDVIGIPLNVDYTEYAKDVISNIDSTCNKMPKFVYKDHHMAHLCEAIYQSGFSDCACLVIDGMGDSRDSITLAEFKEDKINIIKKFPATASLGIMYSCASVDFVKMGEFSEGKLMGLSSFGIPNQPMPLYWEDDEIKTKYPQFIEASDVDMYNFYKYEQTYTSYFKKNCYPYDYSGENDSKLYYANFAASVQKTYEEITLSVLKYLRDNTTSNNLVLSGGCIQNCITNNMIVESNMFKNVFASPVPHDAGCSIGLAFYGSMECGDKIINKRTVNSYVGKCYTDDEILKECDGMVVEEYDIDKIAKELCYNKIFAWFQDGSEIGPRALGHRSIIGNPSCRDNLLKINNTLKHREVWRPLAPTVPSELFDDVFTTNNKDMCEFMLRTLTINEKYRKKLIAVCHVDNTTRPQLLNREQNSEFYDLIMKFYKYSNIPGLINTSFNDKHQPIIETPKEAVKYLKEHEDMEGIIFNAKYVIRRKDV